MSQTNLTDQVVPPRIDWSKAPEGAEKYNLFNHTFYRGERPNLERFVPDRGWMKSYLMPSNEKFVIRERVWPEKGTLPPVGTLCEYLFAEGDEWRACEVVAHFGGCAVVCDLCDDGAERVCPDEIRPAPTPEQIADREKSVAEIQADLDVPLAIANRAYEKGYRKQLI